MVVPLRSLIKAIAFL